MDHVDQILMQWATERPDLDASAMGVVGRVSILSTAFRTEMEKTFARFGLNGAGFDVMATLRRSGAPYTLSPGQLLASTMVTSGTMTNRIDKLVKAGWVRRIQNPADSRSFLISLTPEGFTLIDRAVEAHVATQARLLSPLSEDERTRLVGLLSKLMPATKG
jgi:DNA-binding MarR family transcriptional regulator